jgi:hypothetical protein
MGQPAATRLFPAELFLEDGDGPSTAGDQFRCQSARWSASDDRCVLWFHEQTIAIVIPIPQWRESSLAPSG